MTAGETHALNVGDKIKVTERTGTVLYGEVIEKGYHDLKVKWDDGAVSMMGWERSNPFEKQ